MTDARLLIPLAELPGLDPVGLFLRDGDRVGLCFCDDVTAPGRNDVTLDLADAATRDRCLRWLAGRVGLDTRGRCPWWWATTTVGWGLGYGARGRWEAFGAAGAWNEVPALADLDPTDDTRIRDGSRLVDALALAAVLRRR